MNSQNSRLLKKCYLMVLAIHNTPFRIRGSIRMVASLMVVAGLLASIGARSLAGNIQVDNKIRELPILTQSIEPDWLIKSPSRKSAIYRTGLDGELVLDNGLLRRTFLVSPNLACTGLQQLQTGEAFIRSIQPECRVTLNQKEYDVGGLVGAPVGNFLKPDWYKSLRSNPSAFQLKDFDVGPMVARFPWRPRTEWIANHSDWPPKGIELRFHFEAPVDVAELRGVRLTVHYELYDGLPLLCKWISLENGSARSVHLDSFTSEILACVEPSSQVEDLAEPRLPNLHVETDFTTCSMHGASSQPDAVYWLEDPEYRTQVNYLLKTKCKLECRPSIGPSIDIAPKEKFDSFRAWILAHENRDTVRQGLALNRMYQTIAPWVNENPIIHHVRNADPKSVELAVDQSSEVGFELVIMTFGSGFNIENDSKEYLDGMSRLADYAHSKNIALGGYSLLASRSVGPTEDVVNPKTGKTGGFARFGNSPCLESHWGQSYFSKLENFYQTTNADCLEHDGSYPGDECASTEHPGHKGHADSRWRQWQRISKFYQWCRARGIYLNVPDWYFLHGSSKNGMGYRETNWSLPRDYQEIIERQNICDGTRYKLPTMGWMFVPLTEYHGGGAEATIEPLKDHLDHYERRLQNLFGAGVQACFRGPRIFDTDETRDVVKRWVSFYKDNRAILDSSLVPLRRADGRDWDGWVHVNPRLSTSALAMLYNPTKEVMTRTVTVPLYYAGLVQTANVKIGDRLPVAIELDRREAATIEVSIPAQGVLPIWFTR